MSLKRKILISIILVLLFTGLIAYFIIWPTVRDIRKISQSIYLERLDLEKKYQRGQLLRKTLADFEKIKPEREKLTSIFITEGKELDFITTLEKVALINNVNQEIKLKAEEKIKNGEGAKSYLTTPLAVNISGNFIDVLKYLNSLQMLRYYFNIANFSLSSASANNNVTGEVKASFEGEVYSLPKT